MSMYTMTVEEMIAEELDEPGASESADLPLEVELDKKGAYSISGPLPLAPWSGEQNAGLQLASD